MKGISRAGLVLLALSLCAPLTVAQVTTATIFGTVKDDSGADLPGVTLTIKHLETGLVRSLI